MKSQKKSDERALGYIATAFYALSLALCGVVAYAFVALSLAVFDQAGQALYYTGVKF
jgi:hypothetical protein